jgi:hypothetical protein
MTVKANGMTRLTPHSIHRSFVSGCSVYRRSKLLWICCMFAAIGILNPVACDIDTTSLPVERAEIVGQYRATYLEDAVEMIVLRDDGSYEHRYQPQGDSALVQTGSWELINELGRTDRPRIRFKDFVNWYPLDLNCYSTAERGEVDTTPRGWMPYLEKSRDGVIRIKRCPNQHQYYVLER